MIRSIRSISLAACLLVASAALHANPQDFYLVNHTGTDIYQVYISWSGRNSWEEDILGDSILPAGETLYISFPGREACYWDLMAMDADENQIGFYEIDLCGTTSVQLTCDGNGTCYATIQ